jgi:hypothetical protein
MRLLYRVPSSRRFAVAFAAFASTLGVAHLAHAQNVTLAFPASQSNPTWLGPSGSALASQPPRSAGYNPYGISFSDCESDYAWQFPIVVTYPGGTTGEDSLQVWAGAQDCTQAANRADGSGAGGTCVPVTAPLVLSALTSNVIVYTRDIAMAINAIAPVGVGNLASFASTHANSDAACFRQQGSAALALGLYFLAFTDGGATVDTTISYSAPLATGASGTNGIFIDLVGPVAPTGVSLDSRDNSVDVSWLPASDSDTYGFEVFCAPGGAPDAAAEPPIDAQCSSGVGTGDGGAAVGPCPAAPNANSNTCSSPLLGANGAIGSEIPLSYFCGPQVEGMTVTSQLETNLTNGTDYAFGVAGFDGFQNIGALAVAGCADPDPTSANEAGGGGGCAIDAAGAHVGSTASCGGLAIGALAFLGRRRRQRRR